MKSQRTRYIFRYTPISAWLDARAPLVISNADFVRPGSEGFPARPALPSAFTPVAATSLSPDGASRVRTMPRADRA